MVLEDDDDDEDVGGGGQEEERQVAGDEGDVAWLTVPQLCVREVADQLIYDVLVRVVQHFRVVHHDETPPRPRPALPSEAFIPYSSTTSNYRAHLNPEYDTFPPLLQA